MPQKPNYESKKIRILGENGINFKFPVSFREIWWPVRETGRFVSYPGELSVRQAIGCIDCSFWGSCSSLLCTFCNFSYQSGTCCSTSFPGFSSRAGRREPWQHVALQLVFQETLSICLQLLVHYLLDHLKHCSDLCVMVYTSATGSYKGDSLVHSHLTRKLVWFS